MRYVETVCPRDCYDTCFMKVLIDDNDKPVKVIGDERNPITRGFLCPRGVADIKRAYSKGRVLYPFKRVGNKPQGSFERISWNEALDLLAKKLKCVIDEFGADSVLHLDYCGNNGLLTLHLPQRLFYALGFSQTDLGICSKSGHNALSLHYGSSYGFDPELLPNMKLTVYWGFNAAVSASHIHALSLESRKKGGVIIAVDPRQNETTKTADLHIQPKPGSDVALAYGIMKHLIDNDHVDLNFVQRYTCGFDRLKREISKWNANLIKKCTGLKLSVIAELAGLYAKLKPSVTMIGIGMQKSLYGAESVRAVSFISPLVGLPMGFYYTNGRVWNIDVPYLSGEGLTRKKIKVVSQTALGRHLEDGEFKFVYVYNMNPAVTLPNQNAVGKGLARKDVFVVVHDTHWTETAKNADLVLPAATFLEKEDIVVSYTHRHVRRSEGAIETLGESKSELWIMAQLAKRFDLKEEWLYENCWKAVEKAMENAFEDGSFADLMAGKILKLKINAQDKYQTSSGKIEFYSSKAEELGFSPLPKQYPLPRGNDFVLLNNAIAKYTHTQFQDVYGLIPAIVHINPEDAEAYAVHDGDAVELCNSFGSIKLQAVVSDSVPRGVLWMPREGKDIDGRPQNAIVPDTTQRLGGGPIFNSVTVKIRTSGE